jgi:hypothetical protein
MSRVTIDVRGLPETKRLLGQLTGTQLQNRTRRALRRGGAKFRDELRRQVSSRDDLPRSFAKIRTRAHRDPLGISVRPDSPLLSIFEGGAEPHKIGAGGQLLTNPEEGFFARGPVDHPGMEARPVLEPAFDAAHDDAARAALDELFGGLP